MIKNMRYRFVLPLCLFLTLGGFLWRGLSFNSTELPSALIGKEGPKFKVTTVEDPNQWVNESLLQGHISLVNVWASWCISCRKEHAIWLNIKDSALSKTIQLIGLNYHDTLEDSQAWLKKAGNPYQMNLFDDKGLLGIEFGVYGTPETYVLDKNGIIRYKHIGPMSFEIWQNNILPLIEQLKD